MAKFKIKQIGKMQNGSNWILFVKIVDDIAMKTCLTTELNYSVGQEIDIPDYNLHLLKWEIINQKHKIIERVFTRIKNGKQLIGFDVIGCPNLIYLTSKQVKQNTKLNVNEVEILEGSTIKPIFFNIGVKLFNGEICDQTNKYIKDL